MPIISVVNQKGGVAKTTVVANLAASLDALNKRVLVVDIDPQANLTETLYTKDEGAKTIHLLFEESPYLEPDLISPTRFPNVFILPSSLRLSKAEFISGSLVQAQVRLKMYLDEVAQGFQYVLIDCPPSLGTFTLNALFASQLVLIPMIMEKYAVSGLSDLLFTIHSLRKWNPQLSVLGILPTMVNRRYRLHLDLLRAMREKFRGDTIFFMDRLLISTSTAIKASTMERKTVIEGSKFISTPSYRQFKELAEWLVRVVV